MSAEEFSKILTRKQASFLCISDLIEDYLGSQSASLEYPFQLVQAPYTFLRIRKEKKYKLRKNDSKIYRQAVLDYANIQVWTSISSLQTPSCSKSYRQIKSKGSP